MPTVDELVLKLTVENAEFRRSIDQMQEQLRGFRENATRQTGAVETAANRTAEGFTKLRNEVLGLLGAFFSTRAIIEFTKQITEMDLALGRAASASGVFVKDFGAWQDAARALGGPADTFTKALLNIQNALGQYHAGEQSPFLAMLTRMRIEIARNKDGTTDLEATLLRISNWARQQTNIEWRNFALGRLGFSPDDIANLVEGGQRLDELFQKFKQYQASPGDINALKEMRIAWTELTSAIWATGRSILVEFSPQIVAATNGMRNWINANKEWIATDVLGTLAAIARDVRAVVGVINEAVQATVGWRVAIEAMMALWAVGRIAGILRSIGLINAAMGTTAGTLTGISATLSALPGMFLAAAGSAGIMKALDAGSDWLRDYIHGPGTSDRLHEMHEQGRKQFLGWFGIGGGPTDRPGITPGVSRAQHGVTPDVGRAASGAIDYLVNEKHWDAEHAAAAVGNWIQESGLNPQAGAGSAHQGLLQWDAARQAEIERHFQKPLMSMSFREQMDAADWEMRYGSAREQEAGRAFFAAQGRDAATKVYTEQVERPGNYGWEVPNRQNLARQAAEEHQRSGAAIAAARENALKRLEEIGRTPAPPPVIAPPAPAVPPPDASLRGALHPSAFQPSTTNTTNDNSRTATTHINGPITVTTRATDADGIARGLRNAIARNGLLGQADYGIA